MRDFHFNFTLLRKEIVITIQKQHSNIIHNIPSQKGYS